MSIPKIDRYEIQREIDRGGMAVVYLARDPRLGRVVAIKILPKEFMFSPKSRARFQREAKVMVSFNFPGIVPVYDFGESEGQPFLVMHYMAGGSLVDKIKKEPLSLAETAEILERIAPVLDEAHSRGLIHRDLKPGNVLFDEENRAYLADFGVVKLTEEHSMTLTTQGGVVGTPAYMSPEQVMGKDELDGRSDIYALGAILYQMLTGEVPYASDTPMGQAMMHVVEPTPDILKTRADLPPEVQAIIAKAMAKDRGERYSTATELASAFSDLVTSVGATAAPPKKKARRRPTTAVLLVSILAVFCLITAGGAAAYFITSSDDEEPTSTPTREPATATQRIDIRPSETIGPPATAAIILPGDPTVTRLIELVTEGAPGVAPTLRATATEVTPTATNTRVFIPTARPTAPPTPIPVPPTQPPPPPTNTPPPSLPPTNTPEPPTNTPEPPTNTPQPPTPTPPQPTNTPPPI